MWQPGDSLGGFAGEGDSHSLRHNRMVPAMSVAAAALALFLDVAHFAAGRHLTIAADDAATREGAETEKSHEAHWCRSELEIREPLYAI